MNEELIIELTKKYPAAKKFSELGALECAAVKADCESAEADRKKLLEKHKQELAHIDNRLHQLSIRYSECLAIAGPQPTVVAPVVPSVDIHTEKPTFKTKVIKRYPGRKTIKGKARPSQIRKGTNDVVEFWYPSNNYATKATRLNLGTVEMSDSTKRKAVWLTRSEVEIVKRSNV